MENSRDSDSVHISPLHMRPNSSTDEVKERLLEWMGRSGIFVEKIDIFFGKEGGGPCDAGGQRKRCYAVAKCSVALAIKALNNQEHDGVRMTVSKFLLKKKSKSGGGRGDGGGAAFGCMKWEGGDAGEGEAQKKSGGRKNKKKKKKKKAEAGASDQLDGGVDGPSDTIESFMERCKVPLQDLLSEYGSYEPLEPSKSNDAMPPQPPPSAAAKTGPVRGSGVLQGRDLAAVNISLISVRALVSFVSAASAR